MIIEFVLVRLDAMGKEKVRRKASILGAEMAESAIKDVNVQSLLSETIWSAIRKSSPLFRWILPTPPSTTPPSLTPPSLTPPSTLSTTLH